MKIVPAKIAVIYTRLLANTMIIIKLTALLLLSACLKVNAAANSQLFQDSGRMVKGRIVDEKGNRIGGGTVSVIGTNIAIVANTAGDFTIKVPGGKNELNISSMGFEEARVTLGASNSIMMVLKEKATSLNAVVVTGYTSQRKKDIIGAVSVVNTQDLLSSPAGNVTSQLQGRAPGVTVAGDGAPGSVAKVRIRGFGSFGGSDPLYIVDGVPSTTAINTLNPNDIESLQVLKDAASASVYGSRAANGVVIITTKKGKVGATKVSVDAYYGSNYVSKKDFPKLLNARDYGQMYWRAMSGAGLKPGDAAWGNQQYGSGATPVVPEYIYVNNNGTKYGGAALESLKISNPSLFATLVDPANYDLATHQIVKSANTDWFNEVFSPAAQQNYQVNVSGGSERGTYSMSLNYFDQKSTSTKYSYYKRYSARINSLFRVNKSIRVGENFQLSYINNNLFSVVNSNGTNVSSAYVMEALIPVYDIKGNPAGGAAPGLVGTVDNGIGANPVTEPYRNRFDKTASYAIFGNAYMDIDLMKGLTFHTSFGVDYLSTSVRDFNPLTYEHFQNTTVNSLNNAAVNSNTWTWTNTLAYNPTLGSDHTLQILLGTEAIKTYAELMSASRTNYGVENDPNFLVLNAGLGTQTNTGSFNRSTLSSYFARLDYSYVNKYLLSATLRRDESSKFAANSRAGSFPAVALGWRMSSEKFLEKVDWLNDLKVRASWGIIGNQNGLSNENQFNVYLADPNQSYPLGGNNSTVSNSFVLSRLGNSNAKWEENITKNIGLDASLFQNSISISFEVYNKRTKGLLAPAQLPLTGVSIATANLPFINSGDITNKGIDLGITKRGHITNSLRFETSITFSKYKNMVTRVLDNAEATIAAGSTRAGNVNLTKVGYPIAFYYGYQIDGFYNSQAEVDAYKSKVSSTWLTPAIGRWKIKDVNGDNVINSLDRTYLGSPHPKFQMGLNISLDYKNFDFTTFLFWNYGSQVFNQARYNTDFNTFAFNRSERMLNESWTPELGNNAKLPRLDINDVVSNANVTSYFVEDASYLRVKNLQLGYSLSPAFARKIKMERIRFYIQAQNLFTITGFTGLDPDAIFNGGGTNEAKTSDISLGIVNGTIPTPKQVLFGLSVGF